MLEIPIDSSLLGVLGKVADGVTTQTSDSSISVRALPKEFVGGGTQSFTYSISNNFVSDSLIIDYTTVAQLFQKFAKEPKYDISHLDEFGAALSVSDEERLSELLEQFGDRITTTRILLPTDVNLSTALLVISWFIPQSTCCISVEFLHRGKTSSKKVQDSNLVSVLHGLCASSVLQRNCKAFLVSNLKNISRRRCAEVARSYLPQLNQIEIVSMTYGDFYQETQTESVETDTRASGWIWADIVQSHPKLRLLRCSKGSDYWMPVYLLGSNTSTGWLNYLSIEWSSVSLESGKVTMKTDTSGVDGQLNSSRKPFTEFEVSLTAALMVLNTWVEEISLQMLSFIERKLILKVMKDALGSFVCEKLYKWSLETNLISFSRPKGTFYS